MSTIGSTDSFPVMKSLFFQLKKIVPVKYPKFSKTDALLRFEKMRKFDFKVNKFLGYLNHQFAFELNN